MDEKELLKKAFEYGNVPSNITYCFTEPCPMKTNVSTIYPVSIKTRRLIEGMPSSQMP